MVVDAADLLYTITKNNLLETKNATIRTVNVSTVPESLIALEEMWGDRLGRLQVRQILKVNHLESSQPVEYSFSIVMALCRYAIGCLTRS